MAAVSAEIPVSPGTASTTRPRQPTAGTRGPGRGPGARTPFGFDNPRPERTTRLAAPARDGVASGVTLGLPPKGAWSILPDVPPVAQGDLDGDAAKAESNLAKHGVSFEEAA